MPVNKLTKHYNIIKQFIKCCAGEGDEAQARQAVAAVTPAAERGNVKAQYLLGRYYSQGYHTNRDHQQAVYWYEKAAGKGSEKAAAALLDLYRCDWPDGMDAEQKKEKRGKTKSQGNFRPGRGTGRRAGRASGIFGDGFYRGGLGCDPLRSRKTGRGRRRDKRIETSAEGCAGAE